MEQYFIVPLFFTKVNIATTDEVQGLHPDYAGYLSFAGVTVG